MKQIYLKVAKRMKEYEDQKYNQWRDGTEQILPLLLKNTLLTVITGGAATHVNPETFEQVRYRKIVYQTSLWGRTETYLMVSEIFLRIIF